MVLLEHVASGARLAVGNTHLFSDLVFHFWCFCHDQALFLVFRACVIFQLNSHTIDRIFDAR